MTSRFAVLACLAVVTAGCGSPGSEPLDAEEACLCQGPIGHTSEKLLNRMIVGNALTFVCHFPRFLAPVVPIRKCTLSCAPFVQTASYNTPLMLWVCLVGEKVGAHSRAPKSLSLSRAYRAHGCAPLLSFIKIKPVFED